ncbi:hypothetical protein [Clostridium massiliamazoniense]|uniref:hypothetical protein n=1 Tax=Clostridium massiliamazoniense TaxID=1347366 RepID=UPI0006D84ED8|nr:hypothetical protein [Clostridium massiliamazoniense]
MSIKQRDEGYRSEEIIINYTFNSRDYTMILGLDGNEWYVKEVCDEILDNPIMTSRNNFAVVNRQDLFGGKEIQTKKKPIEIEGTKVDWEKVPKTNSDSNKKEKGYLGSVVGSGLGTVLANKDIVLGCAEGNITSLEKSSKICIIAEQYEKGNQLAQELFLTIEDVDGNFKAKTKLDINYGFEPKIGLYDFTGNGYFDILISMRSGGSGGYYFYYIYSYIDRELKKIFDWQEFNNKLKFDVTYLDNQRVKVVVGILNSEFILDISNKEQAYLDSLYDKNGKLKAPVKGSVSGIVNLYPVSINNDRKFELHIICNIIGVVNQDILGGIIFIEKWGKMKFESVVDWALLFGPEQLGLSKIIR